jgi:predicted Zn finger-like uncharacterized protein
MFTVCPKCSLKLVVTAADLRVAQGYVRCGRCTNVFNALIGLSDEQQAVLARENAATASADGQAAAGLAATPGDEARTIEGADPASDVALEFDPTQTDVSEVFIEPQPDESVGTGSFESITLRSEEEPAADTPPAPAAPREVPGPEPSLASRAVQSATGVPPPERTVRLEDHAPGRPTTRAAQRPAQAETKTARAPGRAEPRTLPSGPKPQNDARAKHDQRTTQPRPERSTPPAPGAAGPARTPGADAGVRPDRGTPRAPSAATPRNVAGNASPNAAAPPKKTAPAEEFEFEPPMPEAPAAARATDGVRLTPGSNAQRAAIVREAARRFIQAQRAPRPPPATRAAAPPIAPRTEASAPSAAEIVDTFEAARAPEPKAAPASAPSERMLRAAVATLAVLLLAQIVHHYRSALAEIGWLRAPLGAVYAAIGMPLEPRWDVAAYEVHQLGAVAGEDRPGALTVRASIKNTASKAQPLPLLRVIVQDRFGNRVAARDVPPRAYLPGSGSGHRDLAAGQRVDAQVELVDPGPSAVGFEIDACLVEATGRVSCANEANVER